MGSITVSGSGAPSNPKNKKLKKKLSTELNTMRAQADDKLLKLLDATPRKAGAFDMEGVSKKKDMEGTHGEQVITAARYVFSSCPRASHLTPIPYVLPIVPRLSRARTYGLTENLLRGPAYLSPRRGRSRTTWLNLVKSYLLLVGVHIRHQLTIEIVTTWPELMTRCDLLKSNAHIQAPTPSDLDTAMMDRWKISSPIRSLFGQVTCQWDLNNVGWDVFSHLWPG